MTDQQSLDDIAMLLARYPGVSSSRGFASDRDNNVHIRFRCNDFTSLKSIASCAVAANVPIKVANPGARLCYESDDVADLPFDVAIDDAGPPDDPPTSSQIFGVFLARSLKKNRLLDGDIADQLQRRWNARPV